MNELPRLPRKATGRRTPPALWNQHDLILYVWNNALCVGSCRRHGKCLLLLLLLFLFGSTILLTPLLPCVADRRSASHRLGPRNSERPDDYWMMRLLALATGSSSTVPVVTVL